MILTTLQKQKIVALGRRRKLKLVLMFGSQAGGKPHAYSDVDIAVISRNKTPGFKAYSTVGNELSGLFPGKKIDLAFVNHANPLFLKQICQNAMLLYGKKRDFSEFKIQSFNRYADYRPYFKLENKFVKNFLNHGHR
jgi:predicted nucleotidyltransferase